MQADKSLAGHLDTAFQDLGESVRRYPRSLLDTRELAPDGPHAAVEVFSRATAAGIAKNSGLTAGRPFAYHGHDN